MFKYEEYDFHKRFSYFIKKLWILDNLAGENIVTGKSVLPNGCFNIAVIEGDGLIVNHQGQEFLLVQGTYFCGQMTEAISVTVLKGSKATMIQLHAWVPVHFSPLDMCQFRDRIVSFESIGFHSDIIRRLPAQGNRLISQNIILFFAPQLTISDVSRLIYLSTSTLIDKKGNYSISALAADLKCSLRYLQKIFRKYVGLSPKQFAVIVKLRSAIDEIAYPHQDNSSLTNLAIDHHFYDQAHFNNTFRSIVKTSPTRFNIPDYFLSLKR